MNDVPLVKANNIHDINTSIIAIKKQLKQLNEAVGLIDMPTIDTSIFVKKSEVVDVVEAGNMNPVTSNAVAEVADSLEPVDEVTSGNMQSVTSNAVARALAEKAPKSAGVSLYYLTPRQLNTASSFTSWVESLQAQGTRFAIFSVGWEEYQSFPYAGGIGYVMIGNSSARAYGQLRDYADANFTRAFYWTDSIATNRYSGIVAI